MDFVDSHIEYNESQMVYLFIVIDLLLQINYYSIMCCVLINIEQLI